MQPRTVVITGAGRGIGLELSRECALRGDTVIAAVRSPSAGLGSLAKSREVEVVTGVDVALGGADLLRTHLAERPVDILLLNAGILERQGPLELDIASIERQLQVNAIGPLRVVRALISNLRAGSKIAIVTSRMGSLADNGSGGFYGYRMSKAALNMAGVSLARDLAPKKVSVVLLHPGYVKTDMTGGGGDVDAATSAKRLLARVDELSLERSGRFIHANGEELPW